MPKMKMTDAIARASAQDEANRNMRKAGRKRWSKEDYNIAVHTYDKLMGYSKEKKVKTMPKRSFKKETASDRRGSRKYRSRSDTTKRPKPHTRSKFWVAGYTRRDGTKVKGHWRKN